MRVAINGAGVGGPALAFWLKRYGHEPMLFERAPARRTGGYVIDFWGLGYELAERMGIVAPLVERAYLMKRLSMVDEDGRESAGMDVTPMRERVNGRFISVARADLAAQLLDACGDIPVRYSESVAAVEQDADGVDVTFTSGARDRFDVLVGADGLHSRVRELVFGPGEKFESALGCHVAALRLHGYSHRDELTYVSHTVPKRHVSRVTLRDDETLILFVWRSELLGDDLDPPGESYKSVLRRVFGGMAWETPAILDALDALDAEDIYFDRVSQIHMPTWSSGRVALVGDAAACASLLAGEGTGLAMIEAYVLAGELHRAGGDVGKAFAAYEDRLRPFVTGKQKSATRMRGFFAPESGFGVAIRNFLVNAMSLPLVGRALLVGALRDDVELPDYA